MTKLLIALTSALLATSCRARDDRDERHSYNKSSETARDDFEHTRKTYEVHLNERLERLDQRIHELAARGTDEARKLGDELRAERDRLAPKLNEVGQQAKAGWDKFEAEVSRGFDNHERKLDDALND
jgi:hypothetical protein